MIRETKEMMHLKVNMDQRAIKALKVTKMIKDHDEFNELLVLA